MSTRSHIGIENSDGSVRYVYCHFDSYKNLEILRKHYNTSKQVKALIKMGDMSHLAPTIDKCMFYKRDCKGKLRVEKASCRSEFLMKCIEDFTFLFINGTWYWKRWSNPLTEN